MPRMVDARHMPHATFARPDLGSFCRLDELGLQVVGQRLEPGRAVLACPVVETDEFARWCRRCGCEAALQRGARAGARADQDRARPEVPRTSGRPMTPCSCINGLPASPRTAVR